MALQDIGRWEREVLGGVISDELIGEVRSDPRFGAAVRMSVLGGLSNLTDDPSWHVNIRDSGRLILATLALYLDASGGLTHRRLRDLSVNSGALSSGRATAILLQLRFIGYVTAAPGHRNGATRLYLPTPQMREAFRKRTHIEMEAAGLLSADAKALAERFDDDALREYIRALGELILRLGPRPRDDLKALGAFMDRNSAALLLYLLFQATDTGGDVFPQPGLARVSASAMARQLHCSRVHIQRLLREAERAGFVGRANAEGIMVTQLLCDRFSTWITLLYVVMGVMARRALAALAQPQRAAAGTG